ILKAPAHPKAEAHPPAEGSEAGTAADTTAAQGPHEVFDSRFYNTFRRAVDACVEHRWITIGVTVLLFVLGIVGMGRVQQQFFPGFEPAVNPGRCLVPRRHLLRRQRRAAQAHGKAPARRARRDLGEHLDRLG
ncbi:efflux RND transporter permease subunit, partial [Staphylococcus aureus]|uniref:efflux RND transporter permease subunit n=1 Tax=Staphylococcus aureus TaxID=1280 RepID=UPI001B3347F8